MDVASQNSHRSTWIWIQSPLLIGLLVCHGTIQFFPLVFPLSSQAAEDLQLYELKYSKGLVKFGDGNYREAEVLLKEALRAKPGDLDASYYLGQAMIRQEKYGEAERVFRQNTDVAPQSGRDWLGLAISQYHQDRYSDALKSLKTAEQILPDDPVVFYYEGLTHSKLKEFDKAIPRFARTMALSPELAQEARYQSGLAYMQKGIGDEARHEFEAVVTTAPESELARSSRAFLEQIKGERVVGPKRWDLSFNISGQYDSNVVVLPIGVQPPGGATGISRKDDYRTVLYGRGEYRPIQTDKWVAGVSYGFYQSFHRTLHKFDLQDHAPTVFVGHQYGPLGIRLQYVFDYVTVGRDKFLFSHALQPIFTLTENNRLFTQIQFRYQYKDFQDNERFPTNSTRDGKNWLVGAMQYFLYDENKGNIRFGYTLDTDRTGGGSPSLATPGVPTNADWAYTGHRVSGGLGLPPVLTMNLDLAFDYYRQDYDNPNSFSFDPTTKRKDNIYIFTGTLKRDLTAWLSAAFQYNYTRDQVNIAAFDYTRSIYSFILTGQF